jgi:hypothetical protein
MNNNSPQNAAIDYDKLAAAIIRQTAGDSNTQGARIPKQKSAAPSNAAASASKPDTPAAQGPSTSSSTTQNARQAPQADSTIESFASWLQETFAGESVAKNQPLTHPISIEDGIPLGANIPIRVKQKIWGNQFIEFRSLLPHYTETSVSIQLEQNSLSFRNVDSSKTYISIEQWTSAFMIFMNIYLEKFPNEAPHLLKYCSIIRQLANSHGDNAWRFYDENFRKLRQSTVLPWQRTISELMVLACTTHKSKHSFRSNFRQSHQSSRKSDTFSRVCYAFNNGTRCKSNPCPFKHICQICREPHPKSKCPKSQNSNSNKR